MAGGAFRAPDPSPGPVTCKESEMCKERKMERLEKTWILELVGTVLLTARLGLWGWTANRVVQVGESVVEVKAELQQEIAEVKVELGKEITEVRAELGKEIAENGKKIAALDKSIEYLDKLAKLAK